MDGAVIRVEGLTKLYGRRRGVADLSFEVRRGEAFGYLGPNGAGKTTTIRTLLDLIRPTRGRVTILGLDARRDSLAIRRRTGYLPGELALYPALAGEEFLRFAARLRGGVDWGFVESLASRLGCALGERIGSLSHGNRQKIGLIQAFMSRPELLVLDEPTLGLDPLVRREFQDLVAETTADGRTVFLSSHDLPEVEQVCDRVGIIRDGSLVAVEDVGGLKARAARRIEIHFAHPVPAEEFAGLPGVSEVSARGDEVRFTIAGPLDAAIKAAARHEVVGLASHEPTLEDVFLAYYGRGNRAKPGAGAAEEAGDAR